MTDPFVKTVTFTRDEAELVGRAIERYLRFRRKKLHPAFRLPTDLLPVSDLENALRKVTSA